MRTVSCWRIEKDRLDEADIAWLTGCCNKLEVTGDTVNESLVPYYTSGLLKITGPRQILVETVSDEQESMLKLKYEGCLTLLKVKLHDSRGIEQRVDYFY